MKGFSIFFKPWNKDIVSSLILETETCSPSPSSYCQLQPLFLRDERKVRLVQTGMKK